MILNQRMNGIALLCIGPTIFGDMPKSGYKAAPV